MIEWSKHVFLFCPHRRYFHGDEDTDGVAVVLDYSAVFCANDEMALGSASVCWKRGLSIPEDISIIGFDDIPQAQYAHPPLTTVRQPLNELGYRAIKYLDYYLKDKIKELPTEILGTELVIRQSTQAPAKR